MSNAQGVMELRLLTSIERFKCFCVLKSSFLLLTQKKRSKRKGSLAGAVGFHGLNVAHTRAARCAGRRYPAACAARPSSLTASTFVSAIVPRRKEEDAP